MQLGNLQLPSTAALWHRETRSYRWPVRPYFAVDDAPAVWYNAEEVVP